MHNTVEQSGVKNVVYHELEPATQTTSHNHWNFDQSL